MRLDERMEVRVSSALRRDLEIAANTRGWTLGQLVRELLRRGLVHELRDWRGEWPRS